MFQRIYARGRFDGLRLAGIDQPENFMRLRKLADAEASLNTIAHKVLEVVPKLEAWPLHRIGAELQRLGCAPGMPVIEGSIRHCLELGLVREAAAGMWQRVTVPKPVTRVAGPRPTDNPDRPADPDNPDHPDKHDNPDNVHPLRVADERIRAADPLERLAIVADVVRSVSASLAALADTIDDTALEYAERMQRNDANSGKLKQLRDLLAELSK
jgi:hypothetical protein